MHLSKLFFSFEGRISRKPFILSNLFLIALIVTPMILFYRGKNTNDIENYITLMSIIILWPALAIQTKRWHDRSKSAWWCLIMLIPYLGPIWAGIENGILAGVDGENEYGNNPLNSNKPENAENT